MKRLFQMAIFFAALFFMAGCSSSKNGTSLKASTGNLSGNWTITDIAVDVPEGFKVTDVFDQAPYADFKGSTWQLIRNGNGSFTMPNGTKENIYWSINKKGDTPQFQFKKLLGEKARNVTEGYLLDLEDISSDGFIAKSPVDVGNGQTGYITYTFTKQ